MINQISERLWDASSAMLSPTSLIDRFLDRLEKLGEGLVPVQANRQSREPIEIDARVEPISA